VWWGLEQNSSVGVEAGEGALTPSSEAPSPYGRED
jgi:hypothetical protein